VRLDILRAAREVFGERGYDGARTREIAERANVTEQMMYRHFRTKAEIFEQSVFMPFFGVVEEFLERLAEQGKRKLSDQQLARDYVSALFGFLRENRGDILSLISMHAHRPELSGTGPGPLDALFEVLETAVASGTAGWARPPADPRMTVRMTFGLVLSMAVLDDFIPGVEAGKDPESLIDGIGEYVLNAVRRGAPPT
jgi:AcrR family transcriptional regulator